MNNSKPHAIYFDDSIHFMYVPVRIFFAGSFFTSGWVAFFLTSRWIDCETLSVLLLSYL